MVALSDAFPTGLECGTLNANVHPGSSVAIVGAGPVGIAAMLTALLVIMCPTTAEYYLNTIRIAVARSFSATAARLQLFLNMKFPDPLQICYRLQREDPWQIRARDCGANRFGSLGKNELIVGYFVEGTAL
jgi:hypothetical protein